MSKELEVIDTLGKEFAEFKQIHTNELNELKKQGSASAETKAQMEAVQKTMDSLEAKFRELAQAKTQAENIPAQKLEAEKKMIDKVLRKGFDSLTEVEKKSLSTDSNPDGGYLVFTQYSNEIVRKIREYSPVREAGARVFAMSSGNSMRWPVQNGDPASAWKGERQNNANSTSPTLKMLEISLHDQLADPYVTQDMVADAAINIEAYLQELVIEQYAVQEGAAFISGSGVGEPKGILSNSDVSILDSGSNTSFDADDMIELFYSLKSGYSRNASWMLNRETLGYVRKFKAGDDNYLWQPGIAGSVPATILGRPYFEATDLVAPVTAAFTDGDKPVIFGDFSKYYVVDKMGIELIRDPFTQYPFVSYKFKKRTGGDVAQPEAFKILRTT